jgi:hypothetical protein
VRDYTDALPPGKRLVQQYKPDLGIA